MNTDLFAACDDQNISVITELLKSNSYNKDILGQALSYVIKSNNLDIIKLILKYNPSISSIDDAFVDAVNDGTDPELINLLQQYCSTGLPPMFHRRNKENKTKLYVMSLIEEEILKNLHKRKEYTESRTTVDRLKKQRQLNDFLYESYLSNNRLTIVRILNKQQKKLPSQFTVNTIFANALFSDNYGMAEMLCIGGDTRLTVDTDGIYSAFENVVDTLDMSSLNWFFDNKLGILPNLDFIDKTYFNFSIKTYQYEKTVHEYTNQMSRLQYSKRVKERSETLRRMNEVINFLKTKVSKDIDDKITEWLSKERSRQQRINNSFRQYNATEIHGYARTIIHDEDDAVDQNTQTVETIGQTNIEQTNSEQTDAEQLIHPRKTLNDAILLCIKEKNKGKPVLSEDEVLTCMTNLIKKYLPVADHENSFRRIENLLNGESVGQLGSVIVFLKEFHKDYIETWIKGFMAESIAQNSCVAGVMERIVTGLRGIEDIELNTIFAKAEGPQLFRIFLREGMNIFGNDTVCKKNLERIALMLISKGANEMTSSEVIKTYLEEYVEEKIKGFGLPLNENKRDAACIIELVADCYESHLLECVKNLLLESRQLTI